MRARHRYRSLRRTALEAAAHKAKPADDSSSRPRGGLPGVGTGSTGVVVRSCSIAVVLAGTTRAAAPWIRSLTTAIDHGAPRSSRIPWRAGGQGYRGAEFVRGARRDSNPRPPGPQLGKSGCAGSSFGSVARSDSSSVVSTFPHFGPRIDARRSLFITDQADQRTRMATRDEEPRALPARGSSRPHGVGRREGRVQQAGVLSPSAARTRARPCRAIVPAARDGVNG
jgi:hypothetical protein